MRNYIWLLLFAVASLALAAQSEEKPAPQAEILGFYAFDPLLGKQHEYAEFNWPSQQAATALVRYELTGFTDRKSVALHFAVTDRYGKVVFKDTREFAVFAGQHEWLMPYSLDLSRLYGDDRYNIRTEVKLTGGNRVEDVLEVVVNGPPPPQVKYSEIRLEDPSTNAVLTSLKPRQLAMVRGTVEVTANTTPHLPQLVVYGVMSKDTLAVANWAEMPFCDVYWDVAQLDMPNGKWRFAIEVRMPEKFIENAVESQPFEMHLVTAFTPSTYTDEVIAGTVMASGTGLLVSKDLGERLMQVERNWYWELEKSR